MLRPLWHRSRPEEALFLAVTGMGYGTWLIQALIAGSILVENCAFSESIVAEKLDGCCPCLPSCSEAHDCGAFLRSKALCTLSRLINKINKSISTVFVY